MRIDNPVLNRELIENLRSPRAFVLLGAFLLLLSSIVLLAWPQGDVQPISQEYISRRIFSSFVLGQLVLLALIAPILSAPSIAGERERRSMDLLLTTPLRPSDILFGKLFSSITFLLLLTIASLPIFTVCFLLGGGIGWREIAYSFLMLFSVAFVCGAIGLAASTFLGRSRNALSLCYITILPFVLIFLFIDPTKSPAPAVTLSVLSLLIGATLIYFTVLRLAQPFDRAPRSADDENQSLQMGMTLNRRKFPDSLISPRGTGLPMEDASNPVFEKELRFELFGNGTFLIRTILFISLLAAIPFFIAAMYGEGGRLWILGFYILIFVILLGPSLGAGIFTQERETATFDLLLTTSLSRREIINAKLLVTLRTVAVLTGFLGLFLPFFLLRNLLGGLSDFIAMLTRVGMCALIVGSTILFVVLLASLISMITKTTLRATVATYTVIGLLFLAPVALYSILTRLGGYAPEMIQPYIITSPFYALAVSERVYDINMIEIGLNLPDTTPWVHAWYYLELVWGGNIIFLGLLYAFYSRCCQFRHDHGL